MLLCPSHFQEEAATCWRSIPAPSFQSLCNNAVSPLSPLSYAYTQFPVSPTSAVLVNATVSSVTQVDATTGAVTALPVAVAPSYVAAAPPATGECRDAVQRADYLIRYVMDPNTGAAQLSSVSVALTVTNILDSAGGIQQSVSVSWADSTAPTAALLPFSGAPGYLEGFPVLAGTKQVSGTKSAVARYTEGLQIPAPGPGGDCDGLHSTSIGFGYNATASCMRRMTLAQLAALCGAGDGAVAVRAAAGAMLDAAVAGGVMVGVWGNSDAANVNEWVALSVVGWPAAAPTWSAADRTCSGIVTGYDLKIVTGVAFASDNVQKKVLYVQLCLTTGSWSFGARGDPTGAWAFPLKFTVRFSALDQGRPAAALRPAPPLAAPLPPDLFYPFLAEGS